MKRIVLIVAISLTLSSVAAVANWGATNIQSSGDPFIVGSTTYSAYLYVISSSVTYDSITKAWSSGDYAKATSSATVSRTAIAEDSSGTAVLRFLNQGYDGGKSGGYVKDDTVSAFMIIADGTTKENTENYLVALYSSQGHTDPVETVTFTASGNQTLGWGSQASNTAWQEIGAVPEPASMSLLLVGLAGIGLRRKLKKAKKAA